MYNIPAIREMVNEALGADDLEVFCSDYFYAVREKFTSEQTKGRRVELLLDHARRQGQIDFLLARVKEKNEFVYQAYEGRLRDLSAPQAPAGTDQRDVAEGEPPIAAREQTQSLRDGLKALSNLMGEPQVRQAVVAFRTDFQAARTQIELLGDYKDLHDLLHTLQFHCYDSIVQEAKRFADDELARENLAEHELTLQRLIEDLREVAARSSLAASETLRIGEDLKQAHEKLRDALDKSDERQLNRVILLLNRVLAVQPSLINTRLNDAARALRLPDLVKAMKRVRDDMIHLSLDPDMVSQFEAGVNALAALNENLSALVSAHDNWQSADLELRRIDANMAQYMEELELSWPKLKAITEPLCNACGESWGPAFKTESEKLEGALAAQDPIKVKQCFRRYRRQAGDRFYRVDLALKKLCGELRQVGDPLDSVLRMIE